MITLQTPSPAYLKSAIERLQRELPQSWRKGPSYDRQTFQVLRGLRPWKPDDLVFDVGANDGRTVKRLHRYLPEPRIVALEPVSSTFEQLCEATQGLPRLQRLRLALGAEPGHHTIYLHASPALNSFDPTWGECRGSEAVQVETLDRLLRALGREHICLLKIDVEGHDLEVLHGAQDALDRRAIEIIMVEAGFGASGRRQPSLEDLQSFLRPYGYFLYGVFNQCRAKLSACIRFNTTPSADPEILVYCDAIFVRGG